MIPSCLTLINIRYVSRVKWSNPEKGVVAHPLYLGVVAIEKGAFWSPSTTIANFTYLLITIPHIRFQVLLSNADNSIQLYSFICTQLNGCSFRKFWNSSIWLLDETLTVTISLVQIGPGSNGNEEVLHIPQSPWTGALLSDDFISYPGYDC